MEGRHSAPAYGDDALAASLSQDPYEVAPLVQPVPGEKTTTNNSAEYKVIFSLG